MFGGKTGFLYRHRKLLAVILAVILALIAVCVIFIETYYHASNTATDVLAEEECSIEMLGKKIVFRPESPKAGLIFYPGGKVEHTAYAPLMKEFAANGILCVLVEMPARLAFLDTNAADGVIEQFPEIERWYIGGHSLGGAMASTYAAKHVPEFEGLLLLGAYSASNLSRSGLNIMLAYGSEDQVLNADIYRRNRRYLPPDYKELVINGGCHAYFGDYGVQSGDGEPTITREEQIRITVDFFINSLREREEASQNEEEQDKAA